MGDVKMLCGLDCGRPAVHMDTYTHGLPGDPGAACCGHADCCDGGMSSWAIEPLPPTRAEVESLRAEVARLTRERDDLAAQLAGKREAVRVSKQATASGLRSGTRVLYSPVLGGTVYAGIVASVPRIVGGTEVVRLEEMELAYGKDTGTRRTTVAAAAVDHLFIEDGE